MNAELALVGAKLQSTGRKPYLIPGGGSNPVGALGYVNAALELVGQVNDLSLRIDHVVHATGSAGTQAGLITGLAARARVCPCSASACAPRGRSKRRMFSNWRVPPRPCAAAKVPSSAKTSSPIAITWAAAMAFPQRPRWRRSRCWRLEGILLDPVYTGKGMAGFIDLVRKGHFKKGQNVVFIHTGGSVGLFGYVDDFQF